MTRRALAATALGATAVACCALLLTAAGAPSALGPPTALGGKCGVFPEPGTEIGSAGGSLPDLRAFNQPISSAKVAPDSDEVIAHIDAHGGGDLHPDFGSPRAYGIPYRVVGKRAKRVRVRFTAYGSESDHGAYRIPLDAPVEGGARSDGDRHVIVYDRARCRLYELYRAFPRPPGERWDADSGVIWDLTSAATRRDGWTSADAAGLPIFPGLVRYDEVRRGRVEHAIRITFESTRDAWIHPATHCAGDSADPAAPAMGTRLRLRADYDISSISGEA
ncbi:MAG: hypothetical protein GEU88_04185, partial [Solirubrobacterales bacterium]|nr:hypothetical protein [Solirubrobacterales bacterium]